MRHRKSIVVVGGNAAGAAAAAKAKRTSPESDVWLIEKGNYISTGTCEIPYAISGEISDYKKLIFYTPESFLNEKKVNVRTGHIVNSIDRKNKSLQVKDIADSRTFNVEYDKLILATGSVVNPLFEEPQPINYFEIKTITDLEKTLSYLEKNHIGTAIIFGAGYVGLEVAEAFTKRGLKVKVIERSPALLNDSEPEIRSAVENDLKLHDIDFYSSATNYQFRTNSGRIGAVVIGSLVLEGDLFINCTGFKPNTALAVAAGLKTGNSGAIIVNNYLQTSDPDIYAAGDCIEVTDFITNNKVNLHLASLAHDQGHLAGFNSVSIQKSVYKKVVKSISFRLFNCFYSHCGLTEEEALADGFPATPVTEVLPNLVKVMPESSTTFAKIVYDRSSKQILGASFRGGKEVSGYCDLISFLIRNRLPVTKLSETDFNYTPALSPFRNILSVLSRKVK